MFIIKNKHSESEQHGLFLYMRSEGSQEVLYTCPAQPSYVNLRMSNLRESSCHHPVEHIPLSKSSQAGLPLPSKLSPCCKLDICRQSRSLCCILRKWLASRAVCPSQNSRKEWGSQLKNMCGKIHVCRVLT